MFRDPEVSECDQSGEAFTLASISYLAILVKYILAKKKKKIKVAIQLHRFPWSPRYVKRVYTLLTAALA